MATIQLIHKRVGNDIKIALGLTDSDVAVDWTTVDRVRASLVSDQQRVKMGDCRIGGPDQTDPTKLLMLYPASQPQYLGVARLVATVTYHDHVSTFDVPVLKFVASTSEEGTGPVEVEAPVTLDPENNNLEIAVEDVDTSVLEAAIDAANEAAERANEAAQHGPYISHETHTWMVWDAEAGEYVDTEVDAGGDGHSPYIGVNGNWWEWDVATEQFVDSGVHAQGPAGRDGTNGTNGQDGAPGADGLDGHSPYVGDNGNWFVFDDSTQQYVDTQVKAQGPAGQNGTNGTNGQDGVPGADGHSPYIGNNGHWFVYDDTTHQYVDTDVDAQGPAGQNGTNGTNGQDGHSPYIGVNGHWYVWDTNTSAFVDSGVSAGADLTDYTDAELQTAIDTAFAGL